jgi:hypothetical protein
LNWQAFTPSINLSGLDFRRMNIAPPEWTRIYPGAKNPLTPALCDAFELPRSTPPHLRALLSQIGRVGRNG